MILSLSALTLSLLAPLWGQQDRPYIDSIANAASLYVPPQDPSQPGLGVAGGSIVTIFGRNLAESTVLADGYPLPIQLSSTTVQIGGMDAHLFFVSPTQINVMVPSALAGNIGDGTTDYVIPPAFVPVVVRSGSTDSNSYTLKITGNGLGIFTKDGSGCGQGVIYQVSSDGSVSPNGPENSADPGNSIIHIYGTGAGKVRVPLPPFAPSLPPDGEPTPPEGLRGSVKPGTFFAETFRDIGDLYDGFATDALTSEHIAFDGGRAPGMVGIDYSQFRLPEHAPEGCAVPLRWYSVAQHFVSQNVTMSIHRGGGQCVDPIQSIGLLTWERTVTVGKDGQSTTQELNIQFVAGKSKDLPVRDTIPPAWGLRQTYAEAEGPSCPSPQDTRLDAGEITARGPDWGPIRIHPDDSLLYNLTLPANAIHKGDFVVAGSGGKDVGPFETILTIPEPIQTDNYPPGTRIPCCRVLNNGAVPSFKWTGGTDQSWVRVGVLSRALPERRGDWLWENDALASAGLLYIFVDTFYGYPPSYDAELSYTQDAVAPVTFQAPGLTKGGLHRYIYRWRFTGLVVADGAGYK